MGALFALIVKHAMRRAARKAGVDKYLWLVPLVPLLCIAFMIFAVGMFIAVEAGAMSSGDCGAAPTAASGNTKTEAQFVQYFESQQIAANGAAGITGNLEQESGLNAATPGGGLAQWLGSRWTDMVAWDQRQNPPLDPNSASGQLTYLVYDLRTTYAKLLAELNAAPDPGTAATMFETVYEGCSGVIGYMQVAPGSLCNDPARRNYAAHALAASGGSTSSTVLVDYAPGGSCLAGGNAGYVNPTAALVPTGGSPSRIDMGVDYTGHGPVLALSDGYILNTNGHGWPGLSFILEQITTGAYAGKCWYYAENIQPAVIDGQTVTAGQVVGTLLPGYPWSEMGWADCASPGTTLAAQLNEQDPGLDPGAWTSAAGASANRLLVSLGAESGIMQSGGPHGPLPAGYP